MDKNMDKNMDRNANTGNTVHFISLVFCFVNSTVQTFSKNSFFFYINM